MMLVTVQSVVFLRICIYLKKLLVFISDLFIGQDYILAYKNKSNYTDEFVSIL